MMKSYEFIEDDRKSNGY